MYEMCRVYREILQLYLGYQDPKVIELGRKSPQEIWWLDDMIGYWYVAQAQFLSW